MNEINAVLAGMFGRLVPEIILAGVACVVFLGGTFRANRHLWAWVSLGGLAAALATTWLAWGHASGEGAETFAAPMLFDGLSDLVRLIAYAGGVVLVLFSWNEVPDRQAADYHACLLTILAGVGLTG